MASKSYHVIAKLNGGWSVKKAGATRASKSFDTQKEAVEYGRNISKNNAMALMIHGKNGRLLDKESFEKDSNSSK